MSKKIKIIGLFVMGMLLAHCKEDQPKISELPHDVLVNELQKENVNRSHNNVQKNPPPETIQQPPPPPEDPVANIVKEITADQICDELQKLSEEKNKILIFFDAMDESGKIEQHIYRFNIVGKKKLGELFDDVKKDGAVDYITSQFDVPYNYTKYSFGRMITSMYGIPQVATVVAENTPVVTQKYWLNSKLCKENECKDSEKKVIPKGSWQTTMGIDSTPIKDQEVYLFIYPSERKYPDINCIN